MPKYFSVEEAAEIIAAEDSDAEIVDVELVILPPEDVNCVTDEEDINDDLLQEVDVRDVPGFVEIHRSDDAQEEIPQSSSSSSDSHDRPHKKQRCVPSWKKGENLKKCRISREQNSEPQRLEETHPLLVTLDPIDLYRLFFDDRLLKLCVDSTNNYAFQKGNHHFHISKDEMQTFLGILLLSGYHTLPNERLYWSTDEDVGVAAVYEKMSRNRFQEIKRFFHLSDNSCLDPNDKLAKLRPFLEIFQENLLQFGVFEKDLSLDEQMVPYYGKHSCKMYIKGKAVKFGFKIWVLASSQGFPFRFEVYTGRKTNASNLPLGEQVVLNLTDCLVSKESHTLYMDRFFSSTGLFRKLKTEHHLRCTGTVLENRTERCPLLSKQEVKKQPRGHHSSFTDGDVVVCQWNDNRPVVAVSNFESVTPLQSANRWISKEKKRSNIPMPYLIHRYNLKMGGVDLLDRFLSEYRPQLRNKKWWWNIFANFLNMAVVAGWRLHQSLNGDLSHLDFRRLVVTPFLYMYSVTVQCLLFEF